MGFLSKFEGKMEDTVEGAAEKMGASPISPVQIAKKAEKQMRREKMVGAGKQYAPTLYTVLVSEKDDARLFGYYPTLAGETETYLAAKAAENGLVMDGQPLVRFIADAGLKHGKFEVIAEMVAAPLVAQLRQEEMERYGIATPRGGARGGYAGRGAASPAGGARGAAGAYGAGVAGAGAAAGAAAGGYGAAPARGGYDEFDPYAEPADKYAGQAGGQGDYFDDAVDPYEPRGAAFLADDPYGADVQGGVPKTIEFGKEPPVAEGERPAVQNVYVYDVTNDRAFTMTGRPMRIGRESKNDIVIPDINASREHAEIRMEPTGAWVLSDLGSTNGTFVNGRQIKSAPLRDADRIIIGTTELEFQIL